MAKRKRHKRKRRRKQKSDVCPENINVDWARLPQDILIMILERLTPIYWVSVDGVCKQWRRALAEIPYWRRCGIPWLIMSGQKDREMRTCVSILENRVWEMELPEANGGYIWGSFHDWLIVVKDIGCYRLQISLLNPFLKSKFDLPITWNFYHKLVFSGLPSQKELICILLNSQCGELAYCVRGSEWWHRHQLGIEPFEDAVFSNGSFFLLSNDYNIWQIDATSISSAINGDNGFTSFSSKIKILVHKVEMPEPYRTNRVLRYLVETFGELYLVCRYFSVNPDAQLETQNFEIYLLDLSIMSWKRIEHLGDRTLFLGKCCSRFFSLKELGVGITNQIYFSNDDPSPWWNEWDSDHLKAMTIRLGLDNSGRRDWGIFSMNTEYQENFCFRGSRDNWAPCWFTAPLWWYGKTFKIRVKN